MRPSIEECELIRSDVEQLLAEASDVLTRVSACVANQERIDALKNQRQAERQKYYSLARLTGLSGLDGPTDEQRSSYNYVETDLTSQIDKLQEPCDEAEQELEKFVPRLRDLVEVLTWEHPPLSALVIAIRNLPIARTALSFTDLSGAKRDLTVLIPRLRQLASFLDEPCLPDQPPATLEASTLQPVPRVIEPPREINPVVGNRKSVIVSAELAERLHAAMTRFKHKRGVAAAKIDISRKSLSIVLNRKRPVSQKTIEKIETYIKLSKPR